MANQCLDLVRTAALAVVTHFLILFNLVADAYSKILDSDMAQLLLAIAHALGRTVAAPFSFAAELVSAAHNKMLDAIVFFANFVATAYDNILDADITEDLIDAFRAVARTVVARYLISADFVAATYHKIPDSNMTHQCLTVANTMSRAVADPFIAFTNSVTAAYNQTFSTDMAHRLLAIASSAARTVACTVAAPFISFANTIATACAAIQWWFEASIYVSCGLFVVILLYCAFTELRRFFFGNTQRPCLYAEEITVSDVEMEDAPPIESEMKDAPSIQSTSPPIACDGPELKGHFYQHPWRIRTPFGWELINKQDRRSAPQVQMQCPWEDRLMWGPDPAWVSSYNSRLLREDAARKQAHQERFEQRKYDIEYAKWAHRCHMSVADKPIYSASAQPPKADSDSDRHVEPTSKPQPKVVKSKATGASERRLQASASTRPPIPAAEPAPPAPTHCRSQKQASASAQAEPTSSTAPVNSAAPAQVEPTSKHQPIIVKSKAIGLSKHRLPASAFTPEPNWTATPAPPASPRRSGQKHVSVSAQPESLSSPAPISSAAPAHVEPIDEPEQDIVESKTAGVPEQILPVSAAILSPTSTAAPDLRAPRRRRTKKHVSVSAHPEPLSPAAPVISAASTQVEPINGPEQEIVESKAVGASEPPPPPSAFVLAPISAAEPAQPAPNEPRRKKHVTFAEVTPEPIPAPAFVPSAAPAPSATTTHAEPSHEDKQAVSVPMPDTEARDAQALVSNEPQSPVFHHKRRSGSKPVERGNNVRTASGNVARRQKKPSAPLSATLKKWLVDQQNTETSQRFAPPSQPSLQPQDGHYGEGALPAHSSAINTPSEDMVMADVAGMFIAEPASEGETGMQGIEQAVAATDAPLPQELAMLDDLPHKVAGRAPEVQEQVMEDVVESLPMALDTMPLLSQASLQTPPQALPAPNVLRIFAEMAAAASSDNGQISFTDADVQPATPQQAIPQPIAPHPASHSEAPQQTIQSQPMPLDVQKEGRDIHMKLFRWAERAELDEADLTELYQELARILDTCRELRRQGIDSPIDQESPSLTQNYCECIKERLEAKGDCGMANEALTLCLNLKDGDFFGDGSEDSCHEEVTGLLNQNADRLNRILGSRTAAGLPSTKDVQELEEDLQVFKSYYTLWPRSYKKYLHGLDDAAPVLLQLLALQLAIEQAKVATPLDNEREWFLNGLQMCQQVLKDYSPLREVTDVPQEQIIEKMVAWMVDSKVQLEAASAGFEIQARQSALCLFARRLRSFDEYCFNENGSPRRNVNASRILRKLQVIKDSIIYMTPGHDSHYYRPIAQEVLQTLQMRYSPTAVSNDGSARSTVAAPSSASAGPIPTDVSMTKDSRTNTEAPGGDLGTRKKVALTLSDSGLRNPKLPTAEYHPLRDGTLTMEGATKLIGEWLDASKDVSNGLKSRNPNEDGVQNLLDIILQRLMQTDEYLLAENHFWKPFATQLSGFWRDTILRDLHKIQGNLRDFEHPVAGKCCHAAAQIWRFAPGSDMVMIPNKIEDLYNLLEPAFKTPHGSKTLYGVQTQWALLINHNSREPFFERSSQTMGELFALIVSRISCWKHVLKTNFGSDIANFTQVKDRLTIMVDWFRALFGNNGEHRALAKQKSPQLCEVGDRVAGLHKNVMAEEKSRSQSAQ
ncbi:hypothetical protein CKM354_000241500 [Cercospora kikuchii]|uniref:Uncharacterized protein n=1 Tax=Cercospora kikuchii TaxID=84275 RepID=A0A9P3CA12_9PEZI|nr:uncharacterized protein CKM354_000241500 [Cercospora kikuchii]GIZ39023.1 hypothetical protein CKM354_000241500 [Cercospora kikuchii]